MHSSTTDNGPQQRKKKNLIIMAIIIGTAVILFAGLVLAQSPFSFSKTYTLQLVFDSEYEWSYCGCDHLKNGTPVLMRRRGDIYIIGKIRKIQKDFRTIVISVRDEYGLREGQVVSTTFIRKPPSNPLNSYRMFLQLAGRHMESEGDISIPRSQRFYFLEFYFIDDRFDSGFSFTENDKLILVKDHVLRRTAIVY